MSEELKPCPFCGGKPEVLPKDPAREGNAWAAVQCVNFDCPTYDGIRSHGVRVGDGQDVSDERGSDAYKSAAITAWNTRPPAIGVEDVPWRDGQPVSNPYRFDAEIAFLTEAARYFSARPTGGEDAAHWSNVYNAENCRKIASRLDALAALPSVPVGGLGARPKAVVPTEYAAELCSRLDAVVTEEDRFHPVGCSTWWEEARVAVDMAKDFIRQQAAISDASQPGTDDAPCVGSEPSLPTEDAAGGWLDISTAPKDGTLVWLGRPHSLRVGFWANGKEYEHKGSVGGGWRDFNEGRDLRFEPTHWQPTPAAPTTPASLDDQIPPRDGEKA